VALLRRDALFAGHSFANAHEIERAMQVATAQLNASQAVIGDDRPKRGAICIGSFLTAC